MVLLTPIEPTNEITFENMLLSYILVFIMPNKTVKGTRRPNAVLKVCSFIGFGGFAKVHQAARPLP
jgi:hypothetical protein